MRPRRPPTVRRRSKLRVDRFECRDRQRVEAVPLIGAARGRVHVRPPRHGPWGQPVERAHHAAGRHGLDRASELLVPRAEARQVGGEVLGKAGIRELVDVERRLVGDEAIEPPEVGAEQARHVAGDPLQPGRGLLQRAHDALERLLGHLHEAGARELAPAERQRQVARLVEVEPQPRFLVNPRELRRVVRLPEGDSAAREPSPDDVRVELEPEGARLRRLRSRILALDLDAAPFVPCRRRAALVHRRLREHVSSVRDDARRVPAYPGATSPASSRGHWTTPGRSPT